MTLRIVAYSDEFLDGVRNLIVPIQRDEFGLPITYEDQPDLRDIAGFYRQGKGDFWVALWGSEVIGSIALVDIGHEQAVLRKMFVKQDYRGKAYGTASRLLERLLEHAGASGIKEIFLGTTTAFRAAHRFYEKADFQQIDEASLPANFPRMKVDTRFYRLAIRTVPDEE